MLPITYNHKYLLVSSDWYICRNEQMLASTVESPFGLPYSIAIETTSLVYYWGLTYTAIFVIMIFAVLCHLIVADCHYHGRWWYIIQHHNQMPQGTLIAKKNLGRFRVESNQCLSNVNIYAKRIVPGSQDPYVFFLGYSAFFYWRTPMFFFTNTLNM